MIEPGLISLLNADETLSGLIGGRIDPLILDENPVYPAVTYRTISSLPTYDLNGSVVEMKTRVEFTSWGTTYGGCKAVNEAVRHVLDAYKGTLTNGVTVSFSWRDGTTVDAFDDVRRVYKSSVDYRLIHTP